MKFRNRNSKVGVRLSRLTKRHYNWKKMFIKHCLNYMLLLPSISMIFDSLSFIYHRYFSHFSDPHLSDYIEAEFLDEQVIKYFNLKLFILLFFRLNQSRNMVIILPIWNVLVQVLANIFSIKKNFKIKYPTKTKPKNCFFCHTK